jgi:pyruvate dehydrogenase (quinone)
MKNNTLGQIKWEQMMFLGNPEYECDLQPIDFATVARGFGISGFRASNGGDLASALDAAFSTEGPVLVEATVDPHEPLLPPKRMQKYAENLERALDRGTAGADHIRAALKREPARTLLS